MIIEPWLCFFSFYVQFVYIYGNFVVAKKITIPQQQITLLICLFFVQFSASVQLDI